QGTAAMELIEEVGELDAILVPMGGGGLLAGTVLATRELLPDAEIYGVEPAAGNDGQRSFRGGSIVRIETPQTIADGAQTQRIGDLTFAIIRRDATDILTATDDELVAAMRFLAGYMKLVVEPTGVLGFAGLRSDAERFAGKRVGVIISGGNIDLARYAALIG
ncbi:MAG TPA: pyridoxal-phosphate dependent enzyme, partial [Thermomicrobiales bacterium]|nr:pyridoxal-phosphate dependent enzyme [Thermomicrobiales bacterium]